MMRKSRNGYWVVLGSLVTNLNLTLEVLVAGPLNGEHVQRTTLIIQ